MALFDEIDKARQGLGAKAAPPVQPGALYPASGGGIPTYPMTFPGWADRGGTWGGGGVLAEERKARFAIQSSWVYSDIMAIAREFSAAELIVKKRDGEELTEVKNHSLEVLWRSPNPHMGRSFLMQMLAMQWLLYGREYLFFTPSGNEPAEIWPVPPVWMTPIAHPELFIDGYAFQPNPNVKPIRLDGAFLCYTRFPNPFDARGGLSPLEAAQLPVEVDVFQARWNRNFFGKQNGIPSAIAILPATMQKPEFERARSEIYDFYGGGQQKIAVARAGDLDFKLLTMTQKDMDFLAGRAFSRDEIDRIYGFSEGYWSGKANRANATNARATLIENVIWPMLCMLAEDLNSQIVPAWYGDEYVVEFKDIRARNTELEIRQGTARQATWAINELRKEEGKDPLEGEIYDTMPAAAALAVLSKGGSMDPSQEPEPSPTPSTDASTPPALPDEQQGDGDTSTAPGQSVDAAAKAADLERWQKKAQKRLRDGKGADCPFVSPHIGDEEATAIRRQLAAATTVSAVKAAFGLEGSAAKAAAPASEPLVSREDYDQAIADAAAFVQGLLDEEGKNE